MKRCKPLEKYIKKYTGINLKVYTVKYHHGGYGAYQKYYSRGYMTINEDLTDFKPLIWHEMGHLMMNDGKGFIEREVDAQLWAFKTLKELNLSKIYRDSLMWVNCRWGSLENDSQNGYGKARKIILETLNNQKKKYSRFADPLKCI